MLQLCGYVVYVDDRCPLLRLDAQYPLLHPGPKRVSLMLPGQFSNMSIHLRSVSRRVYLETLRAIPTRKLLAMRAA